MWLRILALAVVMSTGCSQSPELPVFSYKPVAPEADKPLTIHYRPLISGSALARSDSVRLRITLVGPRGELYADALPMERARDGWRLRFKPGDYLAPDPVVMVCAFEDSEDPENCDGNQGRPWILLFHDDGELARGAAYQTYRLCKSHVWLPADLGIPDHERGRDGIEYELRAHPDFVPARLEHWSIALAEDKEDSLALDSLRHAIRTALDSILEANLRALDPDTMIARAFELYEVLGESSRAESLLAVVRDRFPQSRLALRCEYEWAFAPWEPEPVIERFQRLLEAYPDSPEAKRGRGFLFAIYNNVLQMPEQAAEIAASGKPMDLGFLRLYAEDLAESGELEEAELVARRCVREAESETWSAGSGLTPAEWTRRQDQELRDHIVLLASILGEKREYEEAVALLEEVAHTNPRAAGSGALEELAEYQAFLGRREDALRTYDLLGETFRPSDEIVEVWRSLYVDARGEESGFDEHHATLDAKRRANAHQRLERRVLDWPAPEVVLTDLDGNRRPLSEFRGKVVFIDFWATWCGPCLSSMSKFEEAYRTLGTGPDVVFIALNTWEKGNLEERRRKIEEKWTEIGLSLPVLLDMGSEGEEPYPAADLFRVRGIPTSFLLDRDGRILFRAGGLFSENDVENLRLKIDFARNRRGAEAS